MRRVLALAAVILGYIFAKLFLSQTVRKYLCGRKGEPRHPSLAFFQPLLSNDRL